MGMGRAGFLKHTTNDIGILQMNRGKTRINDLDFYMLTLNAILVLGSHAKFGVHIVNLIECRNLLLL
jgi:hypothetical protein